MKRVLGFLGIFILCVALALPAFATGIEFVPSITAKPAPDVVVDGTSVTVDGTGDAGSGDAGTGSSGSGVPVLIVENEKGEVVHATPIYNLIITAVSQVQDEEKLKEVVISDEAIKALQDAYDELNSEGFKISEKAPDVLEHLEDALIAQVIDRVTEAKKAEGAGAEEIEAAVEEVVEATKSLLAEIADNAVVTALFDVTILSDEANEHLDVDGHTTDLTFEADIPEDHLVFVMVFKENKWQLIDHVAVNDDGTITCTFEHFCPVAILTAPIVEEAPAPAQEAAFPWWWIVLAAVVVAGGTGVAVKSKNSKKAEVTK